MEEQEKQPNEKLRRERELRGWSQQKVAELIGTSNQAVNRWENGQHKPGRYFQTLLCELFGKNAEELGFMGDLSFSKTEKKTEQELWIDSQKESGERDLEYQWSKTAKRGTSASLNTSSLRFYNYSLSFSWGYYYARGSHALPPIIDDCLRSLTESMQTAHGSEQVHLIDLLCRFYQLSGVVARDQMNISRALSDGKKAVELAFSAENVELIAASLFRRAKTRMKQAQYDAALQELEAALVYAQRSRDPLKGYIHQAMAEAYTMLADPYDQHIQQKSLALLDTVSTIVENGNLEDDGSFVKLNITGLAMDRASVFTHFLQPEEARRSLLIAQQHLGTDLNRWRSRLLIANAETSLAENDAQSCCEYLTKALNIVQETHSRSNEKRVMTIYQQLSTIAPHSSFVRQVGEQLRAL